MRAGRKAAPPSIDQGGQCGRDGHALDIENVLDGNGQAGRLAGPDGARDRPDEREVGNFKAEVASLILRREIPHEDGNREEVVVHEDGGSGPVEVFRRSSLAASLCAV